VWDARIGDLIPVASIRITRTSILRYQGAAVIRVVAADVLMLVGCSEDIRKTYAPIARTSR
jgi:hypothetical protein